MGQPDEWQPIETAPKSRETYIPILGFCPDAPRWKLLGEARIRVVWWEPALDLWHDGTDPRGMFHQPTKWMPLPDVPAEYRRKEVSDEATG